MPDDAPDDPRPLTGAPPQAAGVVLIDGLRWSGAGAANGPDDAGRISIPGVDVGERIEAALDGYRWRLRRIIDRSLHRIDPDCEQIGACPGCPVRGLSMERRRTLTDALHRRALGPAFAHIPWRRLPGASDRGGRSRAVARALRGPDGALVLGMVRGGDEPIELGRCPLQDDGSRGLVARLQRDLRAAAVPPWDPEARQGTLRHVVVQTVGPAARVTLAVDDRGPPIPIEALLPDRPDVPILLDALPRRGAGLMRRPQPARGEPWLCFDMDGDRFRAGPRSWIPQAPGTVPAIRRAVVEALLGAAPGPTAGWSIIEVGCGVGILSLPIARRAAHFTGVDIERDAVLDAEVNAAANGVGHATFRTGEATHALRRLLAEGRACDGLVMHAMRRPFGPSAMAAVRALAPRRIVCLSPFAPALSDDLAELPGYRPISVALCDQTPGTVPDLTIVTLARDP